jgi:hypothetical protein
MGYKPSDPTEYMEQYAAARAQRAQSQRALDDLRLMGLSENDAARLARGAGLDFRPVYPDRSAQVMTLDVSLTRVTATIRGGIVHDVSIG